MNIIVFLWTNFLWSHEVFVLEFRPGPVAPHPVLKLNISWPQPCSMHPLLIDNNRSNPVLGQLKTVLTNPLWHLSPSSKRLINLSVTVSADCMISYSHLATGHPEKPLIRSHCWFTADERMVTITGQEEWQWHMEHIPTDPFTEILSGTIVLAGGIKMEMGGSLSCSDVYYERQCLHHHQTWRRCLFIWCIDSIC